MNLLSFVKDVGQRAGLVITQEIVNHENAKTHLIRQFNMFHKDFNKRYPWPWRSKEVTLQTVANYTEGTVQVTNGSRTVTGTGMTFTATMVGRLLKLDREDEVYEILSVTNATTLVLKVPYLGASASGQAYLIWKKYYELDPEVPYLSDITIAQWPYVSREIPKKAFDANLIRAWQINTVNLCWTWGGIDRSIATYGAGGTITVVNDSRTLTGTATTFLGNVQGGARIRVGTNYYNVESVDSNTQITMVQRALVDASATSNYAIESPNRARIQLSSVPDPQINLIVRFFKRTYDLLHDNDEPEFWDGHDHIITNAMYGYQLEKMTSEKAFAWLDVYRSAIKEAWINLNERDSMEQVPRFQRGTPANIRPTIYG